MPDRKELDKVRSIIEKEYVRHKASKLAFINAEHDLEKAKDDLADAKDAQAFLQKAAAEIQRVAHKQISEVVTSALHTVFPDADYSFQIRFEEKRGKTDARMVLVKDGHEVNPIQADSGGVVQVAAFALRVAALMLAVPRPRKLLVLDEPFAMVAADRMPALVTVLETLSEKLGIQIILVTHMKSLQVGTVVEIGEES